MARRDKPINADVAAPPAPAGRASKPAPPPGEREKKPERPVEAPTASPERPAEPPAWPVKPEPPPPKPKRKRKPIPAALKAIAALVVVAIAFIVAAIVGGSGDEGGTIPSAAPSAEAPPRADEPAPSAAGSETPTEIGYPAFATNNTVRVGGPDPVSNAAAVALAVYPSGGKEGGPDAVTVVDGADWRGAIAAAVLMAQPLEAPILISDADEAPEPTAEALAALDPPGSRRAGGAQAIAIGAAAVPDGIRARRVGATGNAAAAAIARLSEKLLRRPPERFVLVPESRPEIAMPAAAWAARSGDPILFSGRTKLPQETRDALRRHPQVPVHLLGPRSAISAKVAREVEKIGNPVSRVGGKDPVANAIALARHSDGEFGWNINDPGHGFVVARSDSPLDAAAAAPLSASGTWGPLLLTDDADTLPPALRDYLLDVKPGYTSDPTRAFYNHVWVIGDEDAIGVEQQAEIDELAELARIGGEP